MEGMVITISVIFGIFMLMNCNANRVERAIIIKERAPIADIVLIIDESGSIGAVDYVEEISFCKQFVASFPVAENRTRFALIQFDSIAKVHLTWREGTSQQAVQNRLNELRQNGDGTDFEKAWTLVSEELQKKTSGDRPEAPNVAVMITDGVFLNSEKGPTFAAARKLRSTGTLLYAIHVGSNSAPIMDLTEMTGNRSRVYAVRDFKRLTDEVLTQITQQITEEFQDCAFEYVSTGLCYRTSIDGDCIQDKILKIIRHPQRPFGTECPNITMEQIPCDHSSCQNACDQWTWTPWGNCTSEMCGFNGTKSRQRQDPPPYSKLNTSCHLNESMDCTQEEQDGLLCALDGSAEKLEGLKTGVPLWGIILIIIVCLVLTGMMITGFIMYRSPRWRMVFILSEQTTNQLPGNIHDKDAESTQFLERQL